MKRLLFLALGLNLFWNADIFGRTENHPPFYSCIDVAQNSIGHEKSGVIEIYQGKNEKVISFGINTTDNFAYTIEDVKGNIRFTSIGFGFTTYAVNTEDFSKGNYVIRVFLEEGIEHTASFTIQ